MSLCESNCCSGCTVVIQTPVMSALCQKRTHAPQQNTDRLGQNRADEIGLTLVFNEGVRAIATAGGFCVPLALVIRKRTGTSLMLQVIGIAQGSSVGCWRSRRVVVSRSAIPKSTQG